MAAVGHFGSFRFAQLRSVDASEAAVQERPLEIWPIDGLKVFIKFSTLLATPGELDFPAFDA